MSIDWFRDLTISILGLVAAGVLIFITVLIFSLYRRIRPILDSIKTTSQKIQELSSYTVDGVAKPLFQVLAVIQGVRQGIDAVSKLFKKGGKDGR
ncbi:hypothetical protein ACFLYE_03475 [Chloroflexota bacterium]